ncbi:hypothetical protein HL658_06060 [Azospirillum sp. RWY-5-1]|uniref:Uncharacterized protein n=1 Tax=Azospirillum oleiclasticum TaxID=2735135 RepID=A0ABX2T7M6_9PROT|nr:DUF6524 family protein [Azospirillum oleiclasticum]NYZ12107.1 hypothetical protein [Azospirillum oleiclasticum]NYZ19267.1 hypothetical protein [Azospirillum oleiclasticum]
MAGAAPRFRPSDLFIRFFFLFTLTLASYNPTGYSYVHWALDPSFEYVSVKLVIGMALFLAHAYFIRITHRALQYRGERLAVLFFVSAAWALWSQDLFPSTWSWLVLAVEAAYALYLAAGMSFVLLWQHVSGQVTAIPEVH